MVVNMITNPNEFLKYYMDVVEAIGRGEISPELEMVSTHLAYEKTNKLWTIWETENKKAIEEFYEKITYLKTSEITPVNLVSHLTRSQSFTGDVKPPLTSNAVLALNRIREDLELVLVELGKGIARAGEFNN